MTQQTSIRFGKTAILLGDGATPTEHFAAPCGLETLTMTMNIASNNTSLMDCDDPDAEVWLATDISTKQMTLSGNGTLDRSAMQTWQDWYMDGGEKNVRWFRDLSLADGGGYFQAPAVLTAYSETGNRGGRYQHTIGITLNGKPTFVPASS
jgi:hypothetical protein